MVDIKNKSVPATPRSKNYTKGTVFVKSGGGGGSSVTSSAPAYVLPIIKADEVTQPSDKNIFSALRSVMQFVDRAFFESIFEILTDANGVKTLRIKGNAYTDGGLSALGDNTVSGGTGTGMDYEALQTLLTGTVNSYEINLAFLTAITKSYITEKLGDTYSLLAHNHNALYSLLGHSHSSSTLNNDAGFITLSALAGLATQTYVNDRVSALINGAPAAFDTLKEISDVLQANVSSIGDLITAISTKWTQDNAKITNWDNAATSSHSHGNKSVLDAITQALLDSWNTNSSSISSLSAAMALKRDKSDNSFDSDITALKNLFLNNLISENAVYSNANKISIIKYDLNWDTKSRLSVTDNGVDVVGGFKSDKNTLGTWSQSEDANGDLVFYKNGVVKAKLTTDGFVSMGGVTALGI